ncbi:CDP-alcohol phosphatidyltransferase family protein [Methanocella sp. MCL-LM]|uniref:CDP-alcohol phosphatidyltransferase family protein n=1 Tax=Methanocella sp. MCL-LM TaxID=3412035 RepID=UPI003C78CD33
MSLLYRYKPQKDALLRSASQALLEAGVTPNMVTAAGLALSAAGGIVAMSGHLHAGIAIFLTGAFLDALDGSLARCTGRCTEFGKYFDSFSDRCSELLFVAGAVIGGVPASAFAVVAGSLALLATRVYNHRKGLNSNAAMFGRPERLALLVAGLLAPAPFNTVLFAVAGFFCIVSSAQALASAIKANKMQETPVVDIKLTG